MLDIGAIDMLRHFGRVRNMDFDEAITRLAALSTPSRYRALKLLADAGEEGLSSGVLAQKLGVAQNTLSTQLFVLSAAHLVRKQTIGRSAIYRLNFEAVDELAALLNSDFACRGMSSKRRGGKRRAA